MVYICIFASCSLGVGWRLVTKTGMIDFAGGDVVHLNSGVGALVATIMLEDVIHTILLKE